MDTITSPATKPVSEVLAYTVPAFCRATGIGRTKLFDLLREGRGPRTRRIGKRVVITAPDAQAWLESLPERPQGTAA